MMDDEDPYYPMFGPDTATRDTMRLDRISLELEQLQKEQCSLAKQLFTEERRRRSDKECVQLQLISLAEQMDDMEAELGGDEYLSESMGDFTSEAKDGWTSNGTSKFEKQNFVKIFKKHPLIVFRNNKKYVKSKKKIISKLLKLSSHPTQYLTLSLK